MRFPKLTLNLEIGEKDKKEAAASRPIKGCRGKRE